MIDKSKITENSKRNEWDNMIKDLDSGETVKIHESVYWYFLEVLPPIKMFEHGFHFAEGMEHIKEFINIGNDYSVKRLSKINPLC